MSSFEVPAINMSTPLSDGANQLFDWLDSYIAQKKEEAKTKSKEEAEKIKEEVTEEVEKAIEDKTSENEAAEKEASGLKDALNAVLDAVDTVKEVLSSVSPEKLAEMATGIMNTFTSIAMAFAQLAAAPTILAQDAMRAATVFTQRTPVTTASLTTGWTSESAVPDIDDNIPT